MKQRLQACRDRVGAPPRVLTAADANALRLRVRAIFECFLRDRDDPMVQILEEQHLLRERGQVYWGHLIQGNNFLFSPDNVHTCPAHMVFSTEPFFDDRPDLLSEIGRRLGALKGQEPVDASLADFVRVLTNEIDRILSQELPRDFCDGHSVYFATIFIEPRTLPGGYLAHWQIPVLANPAETPAVMVLPSHFWPADMVAEWNPRPVQAPPKRPRVVEADPDDKPVKGVPDWLPAPTRPGFFSRLFGWTKAWPEGASPWARCIARSPNNDELVHAFADWLDTCGCHARAQLIRLQMEQEEYAENDPRADDLYNRAAELIQANTSSWLGPLKAMGLEPYVGMMYMPYLWFHRGMLDYVDINREGILPEQADRLFAAAPALQRLSVQSMRVTLDGHGIEWEPNLARMFWVPHMRQIHDIDLGNLALKQDNACSIGDIPYLAGLRRLIMSSTEHGLEASLALARTRFLTNLSELGLTSWGMGEEGIRALADSSVFAKLTMLDLTAGYIGPGGAEALFAGRLGPLTILRLSRNRVLDHGAECLAGCQALSGLKELTLDHASLTSLGASALAAMPTLARLRHLSLSSNELDSEGLIQLARSPHLARLRHLDLSFNQIGDDGVQALATSTAIQSLTELHLAGNLLADAAAFALAGSSGQRLRKLTLNRNKIGPDGATALAKSHVLTHLDELNLSNNPIGYGGALAVAQSRSLAELKYLHIGEMDVGKKGLRLLYERFGDKLSEVPADPPETDPPSPTIDDILAAHALSTMRWG